MVWGAYSAPQTIAGFKGPTSKGREWRGRKMKGGLYRERREGRGGKGSEKKRRGGKEEEFSLPSAAYVHYSLFCANN